MTQKNKIVDVFWGNSASQTFSLTAELNGFDENSDELRWIASTAPDGDLLIVKTNDDDGGLEVNGGSVVLTLGSGDTELDPNRYYYHEMVAYRANGNISTVMTGLMRVRRSIGLAVGPIDQYVEPSLDFTEAANSAYAPLL